MDKELLKRKLKGKKIHFTKHFIEKAYIRGIEKSYIEDLLTTLKNLIGKKKVRKMAKKVRINYDFENDILYMFSGERVKDSLQIENFVIDFSYDNKIVGVEILDASKFLSKILETHITKQMLKEDLKEGYMSVYVGREMVFINIKLVFGIKELSNIPIPVPLPIRVVK